MSPEWKQKVGVATSVNWPTGVGGKGNEGVAGLVTQTPGSIGYVELIYALQNKISFGSVQNAAGEFVTASVDAVTKAAAEAVKGMPADFRVSITNAPGAGVYPISSFTWMLFYENPKDKGQAKAMVDFMKWALTDGGQVLRRPRLRAAPRSSSSSRWRPWRRSIGFVESTDRCPTLLVSFGILTSASGWAPVSSPSSSC